HKQSTKPITPRRTAPQAPRNRIRANADNRKASDPSLFERLWQPSLVNIYRKPVSGLFRHNAFWFRGLWRKPGQHFALRGRNPAGQFLQEEYDEVQRTCARARRNFWRCTSGSYSAGRDIGAESEPSTTGIKFDIAATDQIRPIATTTAIIHASICIPSTSR